jgi:aminoglycoside phosphotransferase (APT) family kinase protein
MEKEAVNIPALEEYLAKHLPGESAPVSLKRIGDGHSNLTFLLTRGAEEMVLRRPPFGELLPSTHDMQREFTFCRALYGSEVPVPKPIWFCDDKTVIGANFYLMEYLSGIVMRSSVPPTWDNPTAKASLARATIETLAKMHTVDFMKVGLDKIGKVQGYLERQVRRRTEQLQLAIQHTRPLPVMLKVADWLRDNLPETEYNGIVHGDFRMDNMIFAPEPPARPLGVLDWETATVGDTLVDVGFLSCYFQEPGKEPMPFSGDIHRLTSQEGFPNRQEFIGMYAELTGRKPKNLAYYQAFSIWKLAISLEGSYGRYLAGAENDPLMATMEQTIPAMADYAWEICKSGH